MLSLLSSPVFRNILLWLCLVLPWLNPFTSPPSTSVLPLLLSWMMAACALLLVADVPMLGQHPKLSLHALSGTRFFWLGCCVAFGVCVSLFTVPQVIDVGATFGLVAAVVCVGSMAWVGRRVAWQPNRLMPWLVSAWLAAAVISSVLGLLQYLDLASSLSPWVNQPAFKGDAFANLRQRNQFASLTSIGLVAVLAMTYALWQRSESLQTLGWLGPRYRVAMVFFCLNVLAMGAACSMSRTAVLQWVVVSALAILWTGWQRKVQQTQSTNVLLTRQAPHNSLAWWGLLLSAPLLLFFWSFVMPWVAQHLTGQQGANLALRLAGSASDYGECGSRSVLWANVWQLIAQKPLLGWGWGETDLAHFLTAYSGQRFCDILDNAHNLPLHLALEFGVPLGLGILLLVLGWIWRRRPWQELDIWRVMAWGVLLVVGLHSMLEYPLWYGPFQMAVGLCIGLLWSLPERQPTNMQDIDLNTSGTTNLIIEAGSLLLASVFFLACLYAAWDFNRVSQIYKSVEHRDPIYSSNPLAYAKQSWLFRNQAAFAELTLQRVTASNAQAVYDQAQRVVHYSPEPRVVQRLIDSARLLGHDDEADHWAARLTAHQQAMQR